MGDKGNEVTKNTQESVWNNKDWLLRPESAASEINGEGMVLGGDILIYFKMCAYTQGVIDRIAKTTDYTLADEIKTDAGFVMLGNPEKIREQMHNWVNQLIDTTISATNKKE